MKKPFFLGYNNVQKTFVKMHILKNSVDLTKKTTFSFQIGVEGTSFWEFTGQNSWCGTRGHYGGQHGNDVRCPPEEPTWCICKWATAQWIAGEGCGKNVEFDCEATDVCDLKASYQDFNVKLQPAHDCMAKKCKAQWDACPDEYASNGV